MSDPKSHQTASDSKVPVVRPSFQPQVGPNVITPIQSYPGCVVVIPADIPPGRTDINSYYVLAAYISMDVGSTTVQFPDVAGILLVDLPDGFGTSLDAIGKAIDHAAHPPPPTGVGNDAKHRATRGYGTKTWRLGARK